MKLKDKKTDKPMTFKLIQTDCECLTEHEVDTLYGEPITLETLNKYCEDYEEEGGYWYIDFDGDVLSCVEPFDDETEQKRKEIGNYFDTREEAEKAVEKLKAWKRLRDRYGFAFNGKVTDSKGKFCGVKVKYDNEAVTMKEARQAEHDVAILFGGEE